MLKTTYENSAMLIPRNAIIVLILAMMSEWCFSVAAYAQGRIVGKITNELGSPIPSVKVFIISGNKTMMILSSPTGSFAVESIPAGLYTIEAHKRGLPRASAQLAVINNNIHQVDLQLVSPFQRDITFAAVKKTAQTLSVQSSKEQLVVAEPDLADNGKSEIIKQRLLQNYKEPSEAIDLTAAAAKQNAMLQEVLLSAQQQNRAAERRAEEALIALVKKARDEQVVATDAVKTENVLASAEWVREVRAKPLQAELLPDDALLIAIEAALRERERLIDRYARILERLKYISERIEQLAEAEKQAFFDAERQEVQNQINAAEAELRNLKEEIKELEIALKEKEIEYEKLRDALKQDVSVEDKQAEIAYRVLRVAEFHNVHGVITGEIMVDRFGELMYVYFPRFPDGVLAADMKRALQRVGNFKPQLKSGLPILTNVIIKIKLNAP